MVEAPRKRSRRRKKPLTLEERQFVEKVKERLLARVYRSERCDGLPDPDFRYEDVPGLEDDVWER